MKRNKQDDKKYRKQKWQRKTKAQKFASIWLWAVLGTIFVALLGLITTAMVIACWTMPWTFSLYASIVAVVLGITLWALWNE
jgi:uncharacterized membrane protein